MIYEWKCPKNDSQFVEILFQVVVLCVLTLTLRTISAAFSEELDRMKGLEHCIKLARRHYKRCMNLCPYRDTSGLTARLCKQKLNEGLAKCVAKHGGITDEEGA